MELNKFGKTHKPSPSLENGKKYILTNCDTGRNIFVNGIGLFEYNNGFTVGEYFCKVINLCNNRYKLKTEDSFLKDNDSLESPEAAVVLEKEDVKAIECCWYATEEGKPEPLRLMFVGDSITLGANTDIPEDEWWGCRPAVTSLIGSDPDNRFVSVGSMKANQSSENETALFRHEGHGGWMAVDIWGKFYGRWEEDRGLASFMDGWMLKYKPDTIMIQLGTNDTAFASGRDPQHQEAWTEEGMQGVFERYQTLYDIFWRVNPDIQLVIATAPPTTRSDVFQDWLVEFNRRLAVLVEKWQKEGKKVIFANTFEAIWNADSHHGLCSDHVHLSHAGYHAMAGVYYKKFLELYPNGVGK